MIIKFQIPTEVGIPEEGVTCIGLAGTNERDLTCNVDIFDDHLLVLSDALSTVDTKPGLIKFEIQSLINPSNGTNMTESFQISTYTTDGYLIDNITTGLELNFFCNHPCQTCNQTQASQCFTCYNKATSDFTYLFEEKCLDDCPIGMYEVEANTVTEIVATCDLCEYPCLTCDMAPGNCTSCGPGWLLY